MTPGELSDLVNTLPGTTEEQPFGPDVDVFKVGGKIFALLSHGASGSVSLKCDPEWAIDQGGRYGAVTLGYHLNKRHWNTVMLDGRVPDQMLKSMVVHSYDRVVAGRPQALRRRWARPI